MSESAEQILAETIHRTAGTGTGEDGYMKVWVSQHADEVARNIVDALAQEPT